MQNTLIYGIDIAKGSSRARELPRYALAILKDGEVTHQSMVRRQKILNMIQRDRPEIIAVDNIFELAADRSELLSLMERLPEGVKLVQVTGGLQPEPLVRIARKHGLSFDPENPNDEAEACAVLHRRLPRQGRDDPDEGLGDRHDHVQRLLPRAGRRLCDHRPAGRREAVQPTSEPRPRVYARRPQAPEPDGEA